MSAAGDAVADLLARIRALEAECARKDAALRNLIAHDEAMEAQNADYHRLIDEDVPCRSAPLNEAMAALGPWVPTHQEVNGELWREVCRAQEWGNINAWAIAVLESRVGVLWAISAVDLDRTRVGLGRGGQFHSLTPDEARAATEPKP